MIMTVLRKNVKTKKVEVATSAFFVNNPTVY